MALKEVKCPNCSLSQPVPSDGRCVGCGEKIGADIPPELRRPEISEPAYAPQTPAPAGGRSPLFWFLVIGGTILGLIVAGIVTIFIVGYTTYVTKVLSDQPLEMPMVTADPQKAEAVKQRLENMKQTLEQPGAREILVLTPDEINALAASEAKGQEKFYFEILEGDVVHILFTAPDQKRPNKHWNFDVQASFAIENRRLSLKIHKFTTGKIDLPPEVLSRISQAVEQRVSEDPEAAANLDRVENARVENGKLVFDLLSIQ